MTDDVPIELPEPDLHKALGLVFEDVSADLVTASMPVTEMALQGFGIVHGGVYAVIGEAVASVGSAVGVADESKRVLGMSNSTTFLRPVSEGSVHASGTAVHRGRTTWVWDVEMTNDDGKICALSRVTIAIR
jgi:uncharacterized protein (TIGR00369 family)